MRILTLALLGLMMTVAAEGGRGQQGSLVQSTPRLDAELDALLGIYWRLLAVGDIEVPGPPGSREAHLVFHPSGSVTGSDGCNTINGGYTVRGDSITLGPLMGTLMACPLPERLDRRFREALIITRTWKMAGSELTLLDENGRVLARFERRVER